MGKQKRYREEELFELLNEEIGYHSMMADCIIEGGDEDTTRSDHIRHELALRQIRERLMEVDSILEEAKKVFDINAMELLVDKLVDYFDGHRPDKRQATINSYALKELIVKARQFLKDNFSEDK